MKIDKSTVIMNFNFIWLSSYKYAKMIILKDSINNNFYLYTKNLNQWRKY